MTNAQKNRMKEDGAILTVTRHILLMSYMALYDVFEFDEEKIRSFFDEIQKMKIEWHDGQVPTEQMLRQCEDYGIHAYGFMKKIPTSTKLKLVGKNTVPGVLNYLEAGFLVNILVSVIVLKENFQFSNQQVNEYFNKLEYYIDSYTRKQPGCNKYYMNDDMILEIFRDELKIDLITGEKIA